MPFNIFQKLEQLRKLPDHKKQYVAFGGAACITGVIFVFWVVSLSVTLGSSSTAVATNDQSASASSVSPLSAMQANLAAAFAPVGNAFRGMAAYFSPATSTDATAGSTTVAPAIPPRPISNTMNPQVITAVSASTSVSTTGAALITRFLTPGDSGIDVTILQNVLTTQGFYTGPINGKFGPATEAALVKFQKAHGIALTKADGAGLVGTKTKTLINQLLQQ